MSSNFAFKNRLCVLILKGQDTSSQGPIQKVKVRHQPLPSRNIVMFETSTVSESFPATPIKGGTTVHPDSYHTNHSDSLQFPSHGSTSQKDVSIPTSSPFKSLFNKLRHSRKESQELPMISVGASPQKNADSVDNPDLSNNASPNKLVKNKSYKLSRSQGLRKTKKLGNSRNVTTGITGFTTTPSGKDLSLQQIFDVGDREFLVHVRNDHEDSHGQTQAHTQVCDHPHVFASVSEADDQPIVEKRHTITIPSHKENDDPYLRFSSAHLVPPTNASPAHAKKSRKNLRAFRKEEQKELKKELKKLKKQEKLAKKAVRKSSAPNNHALTKADIAALRPPPSGKRNRFHRVSSNAPSDHDSASSGSDSSSSRSSSKDPNRNVINDMEFLLRAVKDKALHDRLPPEVLRELNQYAYLQRQLEEAKEDEEKWRRDNNVPLSGDSFPTDSRYTMPPNDLSEKILAGEWKTGNFGEDPPTPDTLKQYNPKDTHKVVVTVVSTPVVGPVADPDADLDPDPDTYTDTDVSSFCSMDDGIFEPGTLDITLDNFTAPHTIKFLREMKLTQKEQNIGIPHNEVHLDLSTSTVSVKKLPNISDKIKNNLEKIDELDDSHAISLDSSLNTVPSFYQDTINSSDSSSCSVSRSKQLLEHPKKKVDPEHKGPKAKRILFAGISENEMCRGSLAEDLKESQSKIRDLFEHTVGLVDITITMGEPNPLHIQHVDSELLAYEDDLVMSKIETDQRLRKDETDQQVEAEGKNEECDEHEAEGSQSKDGDAKDDEEEDPYRIVVEKRTDRKVVPVKDGAKKAKHTGGRKAYDYEAWCRENEDDDDDDDILDCTKTMILDSPIKKMYDFQVSEKDGALFKACKKESQKMFERKEAYISIMKKAADRLEFGTAGEIKAFLNKVTPHLKIIENAVINQRLDGYDNALMELQQLGFDRYIPDEIGKEDELTLRQIKIYL